MEKKYELTAETKTVWGVPLHRIRALRSFGDVHQGDLGGWVEHEGNLSHDGNCWVADNAAVFGNANVRNGAIVKDRAVASGDAKVEDFAVVDGCSRILDSARVKGHATITNAKVCDRATVSGRMHIDHGYIGGNALLTGSATIEGGWEHITVLYHDVWYTMYPDRASYNRCKQLYAAQIGGDGCITWYDPGVGDFARLVYAAADAKPNDYIIVDRANESYPPFAAAKIPPMTQTAFAKCDPDAYKVLAGLAATLAEADERKRASELNTGDALAKFAWRDDEEGEDET